ncbi:MAG: cyclase family protein [Planctomycetota bacterium]
MNQIIDLTRTLEHGQPGVEFQQKFTVAEKGWNAKTLHLYSHTGTHMDAPIHFGVSEKTIDQIPMSRLWVKGNLVEVELSEDRALLMPDPILNSLGEDLTGQAVLIATGWSQHFDNYKRFRDGLPRISEPLARELVARKVGIVGVEGPSVADVNHLDEVTLIHKILLGGDVIIVEGLVNLDLIGQREFQFGAMPLKIGGGDGTPCRAFAVIDEKPEAR